MDLEQGSVWYYVFKEENFLIIFIPLLSMGGPKLDPTCQYRPEVISLMVPLFIIKFHSPTYGMLVGMLVPQKL